jgi:hypothetical protein
VDPDGSWIQANSLSCDGSQLYVINPGAVFDDSQDHLWVVDTSTYSVTTSLKMMNTNGDNHNDPGSVDVAACHQWDTRPTLVSSAYSHIVEPGETVVYIYTVTNQSPSPISDTLVIETSGSTWPVTLSASSSGVLQWGESFTFTVMVNVPAEAVLGDQDDTLVTIHSSNEPLNQVTTHMISSYSLPVYLPFAMREAGSGCRLIRIPMIKEKHE